MENAIIIGVALIAMIVGVCEALRHFRDEGRTKKIEKCLYAEQ